MNTFLKIPAALFDKRYKSLWLIAAYFLFILCFVSLKGNFPLNDDWSYGEGVHGFLKTGQLSMPTVCAAGFTHVFLGAVFCKIFGFSYVVLRAAVFSIAILGSLALYGALREVGLQRAAAVFCALVYTCNPLMLNLYFSFMSDVTALSFINIYFYLLLRAVKKNSLPLAALSTLALVLAIATRQSAIIFVFCNCSLASLKVRNRRMLILILLASMAIPALCYIGVDKWLLHRSDSVNDYIDAKAAHVQFLANMLHSPVQWFWALIVAIGQSSCYLGLFCVPVLLAIVLQAKSVFVKNIKSSWYWLVLAAGIVFASVFQLVIVQSRLMPFNQNLLRLPMVCALTIMGLNMPSLADRNLKWLTVFSFLLAFVLLTALGYLLPMSMSAANKYIRFGRNNKSQLAVFWLCLISAIVSIIFVAVETIVRCTDRYYLMALAPILLSLAMLARYLKFKIVQPLSIVALLFVAVYSACAAQDYLGWNRARWLGLERLEAQGISSSQIDGGYEYNTLRDISVYASTNRGLEPRRSWRWWPIKGETYIISFSPIPGYTIADRMFYWSALGFKERQVLVLRSENK